MIKENFNGDTPLHSACRHSHLNIIQYLISEAHCNPSCENNDGNTPLHLTCRYGHLNIIQYLISEANCNPSCENNDGDTPLHLACLYYHLHLVQCLLSTGKVDPLAKNKYSKTPMYALNGRLVSLLHLAAHHGWMDIVINLITKYKYETNCKDYCERTPLHYAAINNQLEVVRYLINEQNGDPMIKETFDGDTSLHSACRHSHLNITQYLISEAHCNPSCENNDGDTPLHLACRHSHLNITQSLVRHTATHHVRTIMVIHHFMSP